MYIDRRLAVILIMVITLSSFTIDKAFFKGNSDSNPLVKKFATIINGEWVAKDYIEDLKKTKSPWKTHQNVSFHEMGMAIESKYIKDDSLNFMLEDETNSELTTLLFKKGKVSNSIVMFDTFGIGVDSSYRCLGYELSKADTILTIYTYNHAGTKLKYKRSYERAHNELNGYDSIPGIGGGNSYFINKLLMSGKYSFEDSLGQRHTAEFNDFGKVTGIKNFKTYYINSIFMGIDTDVIYFDYGQKSCINYYFNIDKDTLKLYNYKENPTKNMNVFHPAYKLMRQK